MPVVPVINVVAFDEVGILQHFQNLLDFLGILGIGRFRLSGPRGAIVPLSKPDGTFRGIVDGLQLVVPRLHVGSLVGSPVCVEGNEVATISHIVHMTDVLLHPRCIGGTGRTYAHASGLIAWSQRGGCPCRSGSIAGAILVLFGMLRFVQSKHMRGIGNSRNGTDGRPILMSVHGHVFHVELVLLVGTPRIEPSCTDQSAFCVQCRLPFGAGPSLLRSVVPSLHVHIGNAPAKGCGQVDHQVLMIGHEHATIARSVIGSGQRDHIATLQQETTNAVVGLVGIAKRGLSREEVIGLALLSLIAITDEGQVACLVLWDYDGTI